MSSSMKDKKDIPYGMETVHPDLLDFCAHNILSDRLISEYLAVRGI